MTTKAPQSMLNRGELPTKFWVVTIARVDYKGDARLDDVRAYMTETGAKYFYSYTKNNFERQNSYAYGNGYYDNAVVTLTEYAADDGTVLKTFTNTKETE